MDKKRIEPVLGDWETALANDPAVDPPVGDLDEAVDTEPTKD